MDNFDNPSGLQRLARSEKGSEFLARGGAYEQMEGQGRPRNVVIEFPSLQAARDCYNSPEYQEAKAKRVAAGIAEIVLVEGA